MEYSTTQISELLGIEKSLLISWEKHSKIVSPKRNEFNSRVYSESDFNILKKMKNFTVERKFKIEEAEKLIIQESETKRKVEEVKKTLKDVLELVRKNNFCGKI